MKVLVLPPRHPLTVRDKQTAAFSEAEETQPNPPDDPALFYSFLVNIAIITGVTGQGLSWKGGI